MQCTSFLLSLSVQSLIVRLLPKLEIVGKVSLSEVPFHLPVHVQNKKQSIMGQPAARVGDLHVCPMVTVLVPHVGGPILPPGAPTVFIGGQPAARVGDQAVCTGPPDVILMVQLRS